MLAPDASVRAPAVFGPARRPGGRRPVELCVCGVQFTTYWAHRQTGHHKRYVAAERRRERDAIRETRNVNEAPIVSAAKSQQAA
jgi:hypothetical protein